MPMHNRCRLDSNSYPKQPAAPQVLLQGFRPFSFRAKRLVSNIKCSVRDFFTTRTVSLGCTSLLDFDAISRHMPAGTLVLLASGSTTGSAHSESDTANNAESMTRVEHNDRRGSKAPSGTIKR